MRNLALLSMFFIVLLLSGCGLIDHYYLPPADDTVREIFESANDAMQEKQYGKAVDLYSRIKDNSPFSPYAIEAELSLGDAHYLRGDFLEAAEAYRDFEMLHPRHEAIPYVLYQIGMSLKLNYKSVDKASTEVEEGLQYFYRLQQTYPNTEYGRLALEQIVACRRLLAERELYIADVFWGMGNYQAAWTRYDFVLQNFGDIQDIAEYARSKGEVAYQRYRKGASELVREEVEGSWKRLFDWL